MKRSIITLISGAAIGAGATLTLPDAETAQTAEPTASDIYNNKEVHSLKLVRSQDGAVAKFIIEKTSAIDGVAAYQEAGEKEGQQSVFDAVSEKAKKACSVSPGCFWSSMDSARSVDNVLTANIQNSGAVTISEDVPQLDNLKAEILAEN